MLVAATPGLGAASSSEQLLIWRKSPRLRSTVTEIFRYDLTAKTIYQVLSDDDLPLTLWANHGAIVSQADHLFAIGVFAKRRPLWKRLLTRRMALDASEQPTIFELYPNPLGRFGKICTLLRGASVKRLWVNHDATRLAYVVESNETPTRRFLVTRGTHAGAIEEKVDISSRINTRENIGFGGFFPNGNLLIVVEPSAAKNSQRTRDKAGIFLVTGNGHHWTRIGSRHPFPVAILPSGDCLFRVKPQGIAAIGPCVQRSAHRQLPVRLSSRATPIPSPSGKWLGFLTDSVKLPGLSRVALISLVSMDPPIEVLLPDIQGSKKSSIGIVGWWNGPKQ